MAPIGRKAFLDYWPIRRNLEEPQRIYRSFRWGKALELFILDTRQYRDRKHGTMLGESQKEWLFEGISRSEAIFKFIATSVPMAGGGSDRWDGYPRERSEILGYIREKKITGVIFLSADLHCAAITRIPKSNGLRDITAGPLAAPLNRITEWNRQPVSSFSWRKILILQKSPWIQRWSQSMLWSNSSIRITGSFTAQRSSRPDLGKTLSQSFLGSSRVESVLRVQERAI